MAPVEYDFSGTWFDVELTMVVIMENIMCGSEGCPIDLKTNGACCAFTSGDETYKGKLMGTDKILWDDGETWIRRGASGAPQVTEKEVNTEEKLKEKIQGHLQKRSEAKRPQEARTEKERPQGSNSIRSLASAERSRQASSAVDAEDAKAKAQAEAAGRAKSQAGIDRAQQAFEAEKAKKALALERARTARAQQALAEEAPPRAPSASASRPGGAQEMPERSAATPSPPLDSAARDPTARERGSTPSRQEALKQAFEKEKIRKAAALERARSQTGLGDKDDLAETGLSAPEFEQAKARSEAGIDRARKAFEEERERKAAALERARAKASARVMDSEPPALGGKGQGGKGQQQVQGGKGPLGAGRLQSGSGKQVVGLGHPAGRRPEPWDEQFQFSVGQYVKIRGLGSQPELNGQVATLVKYIEDKSRWQARIPGRPSILVKAENIVQATAEEKASARRSPGPPQWRAKGKGGGKDPLPQCVVQIGPGESGNKFDVRFAEEKTIQGTMRKLVDMLAKRGVCTCEANAPPELIDAAYREATELWRAGEFGPVLGHMESMPEEKIWQDVLFQSEEKAIWIQQDGAVPRRMESLKVLSQNMADVCTLLAEELSDQMAISYTNYWGAMLACYCGDKTYNLHLDNPNGADESGIPDNGLRLTLCYFFNPYWQANGNAVTNCGGGLDIHLTDAWETPPSLLQARKAPVLRIAPHADTLVVFLSRCMAHRVIATQGNTLWFALWVYCYDDQVQKAFDHEAGDLVKDVF